VAATFPLDIVTPERTVLAETAVSVRLPAITGSLGVLAGHAPMLVELGVGECLVRLASGAEETLVISGGFVEVTREKVTALADTAEFATEIDVDHAEKTLLEAREMLSTLEAGNASKRDAANAALQHAQARLRVARGDRG
jgi:F-type H+-transporting ATPase subunit epsilon